ncbi:DUF262 domain-containing protein [Elizabethkingia anophelis]|uniref:DUF262 domain-containing protein n=1 Tax=Elizabethkingia anophelis TaxID=1117645 RepID=UPI0020116B36|nr:DUF262 domain-containing protein [Elizabethkingia anophelis]EJC8061054.1 DUF262 domain-containing protein [Elizabethkingia anophelis]MCL1640999.1 DUF262 domain-containing protein [Elizabethkingia anophelis]MCL1646799.1 DUF262 domain-containing protein [Elizabethkingia anophelis]MCT3927806.1 DUF262 domain-containing protein [Elizabethkingia anophelis]MCT4034029.1 DUF262 domain-containing protein [Elizabethkingia anophelis]
MSEIVKLSESIPSSNVKIIELYNKIESGKLQPHPDFQRKLVWKKQHKYHFIETILLNYPFPEIYIASSEIDVDSLEAKEIVVDGQQRLTTIRDYIKGEGDFDNQKTLKSFAELSNESKKEFLNYYVSVRDLKDLKIEDIKEIFQRINHTEYSLNTVEKQNAQYGDGEFLLFCKQITDKDEITKQDTDIVIDAETRAFFVDFWNFTEIFDDNDNSRMLALQYVSTLVTTLLEPDYFHRNSRTQKYIAEFNNEFPRYSEILETLDRVINFIISLGFNSGSYWFKKPNLFSLIVELSRANLSAINVENFIQSLNNLESLSNQYFAKIGLENMTEDNKQYFEYAQQGINDRKQRLHRGKVLEKIIIDNSETTN